VSFKMTLISIWLPLVAGNKVAMPLLHACNTHTSVSFQRADLDGV